MSSSEFDILPKSHASEKVIILKKEELIIGVRSLSILETKLLTF